MFSLKDQKAKLANINIRAELHGEETKIAVDIKFEIKVSNDVLSEFDPDSKSSLYEKAGEAAQGVLIDEPGHLPALKFPQMAPIKWGWEGAGYDTIVNYGVSGKDDVTMIQTQIDQFRFDLQDGGTVAICFRVVAHPSSDEIGTLSELVQREVTLTLTPPSADDQLRSQLNELGNDDD